MERISFFFFFIRNWKFFWFPSSIFELIHSHPKYVDDLMKSCSLLSWVLYYSYIISKMSFCFADSTIKIGVVAIKFVYCEDHWSAESLRVVPNDISTYFNAGRCI